MAITTTNMGLKEWDQPNDIFSYVDLASNLGLIDAHDHTAGKGVQVPNGGIANLAVDTTKIADSAITANKVANGTLTDGKFAVATLTDSKLASPNNTIMRTLVQASAATGNSGNIGTTQTLFATNGAFIGSGAAGSGLPVAFAFPWTGSLYTVANKATKLRLVAYVGSNATAVGSLLTLALAPVSATGGAAANILSTTVGANIAASVVTVTPTASAQSTLTTADFDPPVDGRYAFTATVGSAMAANSALSITILLMVHYV